MSGALAKRPTARALVHYNPEKGLKTIAVAEAAEKHYARAKDATKLEQAIRTKREALAEFVYWWDTKGPGVNPDGGRPIKNRNGSVAVTPKAGKDGLPGTMIVSRWRKKLNDPDAFEAALEQAIVRCTRIVDFESSAHVYHNSGEHEWYTPSEFIDAARDVLGDIDLDPASSEAANALIKAAQIFTATDDGLLQPWHGRVWMNPPYSQPLVQQFADKLASSILSGDVTAAVVLINNATETEFFHTLAAVSGAICFPKGRVRFWSPGKASATPLQGQAVLYAGPNQEMFCTRFAAFGIVVHIV